MTIEEKPRRRTTWPAAVPLQQAADTVRESPAYRERLGPLADPVADWLDETANTLSWLAPYREHEGGYDMWEQAMRVASIVNGTASSEASPVTRTPGCSCRPQTWHGACQCGCSADDSGCRAAGCCGLVNAAGEAVGK